LYGSAVEMIGEASAIFVKLLGNIASEIALKNKDCKDKEVIVSLDCLKEGIGEHEKKFDFITDIVMGIKKGSGPSYTALEEKMVASTTRREKKLKTNNCCKLNNILAGSQKVESTLNTIETGITKNGIENLSNILIDKQPSGKIINELAVDDEDYD